MFFFLIIFACGMDNVYFAASEMANWSVRTSGVVAIKAHGLMFGMQTLYVSNAMFKTKGISRDFTEISN